MYVYTSVVSDCEQKLKSCYPADIFRRQSCLPWLHRCCVLLVTVQHQFPSVLLFFVSHPAAKRSFITTSTSSKADDQLTVQFSKPKPLAPPKHQAPPPPINAPVAADTRTRPTPAPRAPPSQPKKPPLKKPGLKAPSCPPPLPPPSQGKTVPSVAQ